MGHRNGAGSAKGLVHELGQSWSITSESNSLGINAFERVIGHRIVSTQCLHLHIFTLTYPRHQLLHLLM